MKKAILFIIIINECMQFRLQAQTYKLTYEPKGKIVEFYWEGVSFFTDYESIKLCLMNIYNDSNSGAYMTRKNYFFYQFKNNIDTIIITKHVAQFKSTLISPNAWDIRTENFYLNELVINLLKINKLNIIDEYGNVVHNIYTKKRGSKRKDNLYNQYYNKETKEILITVILDYIKEVNKLI